jgi:hypothetical protein
MVEEALIGITAAAREIGISHSTLSRQVKLGQVRSHNGKVRLSEVLEDRANNIDNTIWMHRSKSKQTESGAGRHSVHTADNGAHAVYAHTVNGCPITAELNTKLGRLLLSDEPYDVIEVGVDAALAGIEMMQTGIDQLRAALKRERERDGPASTGRGELAARPGPRRA